MTVALSARRAVLTPPWVKRPLWKAAREVPSWHIAPALIGDLTDLVAGQSLVTFTNSSPAWGFNSSGVLVQPAANVPFIEYDPATGSALGWRIWDAVTNLALHSRDLTQTVWVKSGITPTRDQIGADGTANTATRLTATASDGTALQTITSASATRVSGFLIKRIIGTGVIQITQDGGTTWNTVTITSQWLRYSIASATVTNPQIGFRIRSSGDEIAVDFAQLQSAATLGPPVATTSLTASSTADVASITGAAFAGIYNASALTVYAEMARGYSGNFTNYDTFYQLSDGTGNNSIPAYGGLNSALVTNFAIQSGGIAQTDYAAFTQSTTAPFKLVQALASNDSRFGANGVITAQDTTVTMPTGINRLNIGSDATGGKQARGYVREMALFKSARPTSNLQTMTQ